MSDTRTVHRPVPQAVVDRFQLDTSFYGAYVEGPWVAQGGVTMAVLGSAKIQDATLLKAVDQLNVASRTWPAYPVAELDKRNHRVVLLARGEKMSDIPEVRKAFGTDLDVRYWGGMGGNDSLPITVGTEANIVDNVNQENVFVHEFAHSLADLALTHIDDRFDAELKAAYDNALATGLWKNTYAISAIGEYWAEGVQSWYDLNRESCVGGDGVHNDINTRDELKTYDVPLYTLLSRVYQEGQKLPA